MSLETLLEAAEYLEWRSNTNARENESSKEFHQYAKSPNSQPNADNSGGSDYGENSIHSPSEDGKEKRRAGGAGTREVHNKLEKNRRAHLKECFETLKGQLPNIDEKKTSNLSILRSALRYIQTLKRKEKAHEQEMQRLAKEKIIAQERIATLKRDLHQMNIEVDMNHWITTEDQETNSTSTATETASQVLSDEEEEEEAADKLTTTTVQIPSGQTLSIIKRAPVQVVPNSVAAVAVSPPTTTTAAAAPVTTAQAVSTSVKGSTVISTITPAGKPQGITKTPVTQILHQAITHRVQLQQQQKALTALQQHHQQQQQQQQHSQLQRIISTHVMPTTGSVLSNSLRAPPQMIRPVGMPHVRQTIVSSQGIPHVSVLRNVVTTSTRPSSSPFNVITTKQLPVLLTPTSTVELPVLSSSSNISAGTSSTARTVSVVTGTSTATSVTAPAATSVAAVSNSQPQAAITGSSNQQPAAQHVSVVKNIITAPLNASVVHPVPHGTQLSALTALTQAIARTPFPMATTVPHVISSTVSQASTTTNNNSPAVPVIPGVNSVSQVSALHPVMSSIAQLSPGMTQTVIPVTMMSSLPLQQNHLMNHTLFKTHIPIMGLQSPLQLQTPVVAGQPMVKPVFVANVVSTSGSSHPPTTIAVATTSQN
ncbi:max-binding protein MNT [Lingula anatina]|uniref:Max-binding protein MNT n=1 Tax=Lingula anatina TaxID=7574 RepID=A0A1S3H1S2_LINAN|nr:max-binding protein MNT [Lingula anatina]|eukprot:XP_013379431.1 max-binding protein MNT [Lingula anatina]